MAIFRFSCFSSAGEDEGVCVEGVGGCSGQDSGAAVGLPLK